MKRFFMALLCLLLVLMALSSGCNKSASTPSATPASSSTSSSISAQDILTRAAQATGGLNTTHFEASTSLKGALPSGNEMSIVGYGDIAFPDKLTESMTITVSGVSIVSDAVLIGNTVYVKNPATGQWQSSPLEAFQGSGIQPNQLFSIVKDATNVVKQADEAVDGVPCYHATGVIAPSALPLVGQGIQQSSLSNIDFEVWVDKSSFLIRQVKLQLDGKLAQGGDVNLDSTTTFSQFDQPVTIQPPM